MIRIRKSYIICTALISIIVACSKYDAGYSSVNDELLSGGQQTVFDEGSNSFGHAFPVLPENLERVHEIGDVQFGATFVSSPAPLNPGRGPLFNNVSCASCHIADGRGKVPGIGDTSVSTLFRVSIPGTDAHGGPLGVPGFGDQLQTRAIFNVIREADVSVTYTEQSSAFDDGTPYSLRVPAYNIYNTYISLPASVMVSPRVAAPVFGLGLLEAIAEADILKNADENDADGDGISGRANYVWNVEYNRSSMGRFGWKANQPSVFQQVAAAYNNDIGITNSLFPIENSFGQPQYDHLNDDIELSDSLLHATTFYIRTLAVPARRNVTNATVKQGKQLFMSAGCYKCHQPDFRTAVDVSFPAISNQLIHPYTDLLLHDMGDGLADNRPDFLANGREWRTAPLWGIGLTQRVNGHNNFLHDGRARSLMEAIMWHGGEALAARNYVKALSATERNALIRFLESL
ncbi:MAG: di-heme oxidoredictase family protein [Ferruginibacter sp.]